MEEESTKNNKTSCVQAVRITEHEELVMHNVLDELCFQFGRSLYDRSGGEKELLDAAATASLLIELLEHYKSTFYMPANYKSKMEKAMSWIIKALLSSAVNTITAGTSLLDETKESVEAVTDLIGHSYPYRTTNQLDMAKRMVIIEKFNHLFHRIGR